MQRIRKIIEIDEELCNGCGQCVPDCAEGSLIIENGKAKLVADKLCDGLGACLGSCPQGALKIIERMSDEFDEEAVEEYLSLQKTAADEKPATGCPSAQLQTFAQVVPAPAVPQQGQGGSLLSHWPVQIRLIPPTAPFLQNCDLLVAADCTAVAAADFQQKYLQGKTVMMGCPKFDDVDEYVGRFADIILQANLKSLTLLIMEVPCCSGMVGILKKAFEEAGKTVPVTQITISRQGAELSRATW